MLKHIFFSVTALAAVGQCLTLQEAKVEGLRLQVEEELKGMSALEIGQYFEDAGISSMLHQDEGLLDELTSSFNVTAGDDVLPVVQCHGMGDFANNPVGMVPLRKAISKRLGGAYVVNAPLAKGDIPDMMASFFMLMEEEVEAFAKFVKNDPKLANGFNAVGWSQGNLWIRGYVEKYNDPPVKNWIAVNGPMVGVVGFPHCNFGLSICRLFDQLVGELAYTEMQHVIAQANYFRDPMLIPKYKEHCLFMPDINNEKDQTHPEYKPNLLKTSNIVAVMALSDTMIWPKESEHFGMYADGSTKTLLPMNQTAWYKDDLFGLKTFSDRGSLHFETAPGDHMQIPEAQLLGYVDQYFK